MAICSVANHEILGITTFLTTKSHRINNFKILKIETGFPHLNMVSFDAFWKVVHGFGPIIKVFRHPSRIIETIYVTNFVTKGSIIGHDPFLIAVQGVGIIIPEMTRSGIIYYGTVTTKIRCRDMKPLFQAQLVLIALWKHTDTISGFSGLGEKNQSSIFATGVEAA